MTGIQLGQWVVVVNPGIVDSVSRPGDIGRLVILDYGDLRPYGVEHPKGGVFKKSEMPGWKFFSDTACCSWASVVRPASPEEVAKSQLASLEGL